MSFLGVILYFIILPLVVVSFQHNLYFTKWDSNNENDIIVQHDCFRVDTWGDKYDIQEITSYCLSEWPSNWNIQKPNFGQEFTFADLSRLNITSQQLYLWSAPMDTVEDYQFYLDQLLTSNETSMIKYSYFNCTLPRFGPICQYSFDEYNPDHSSLNEIIYDRYLANKFLSINQTCYIHLQCNLGQTSLCIGSINICDEIIQCIDGIDEEHCWQLEINECNENEYRCRNGQCIPFSFFHDNATAPDCFDGSDENVERINIDVSNLIGPLFKFEEILCWKSIYRPDNFVISVDGMCYDSYLTHFKDLLFSDISDSISNLCWLALDRYLQLLSPLFLTCDDICQSTYKQIIAVNCPSMFYMPSAPIAFGHIYFAYTKEYIVEQIEWTNEPEYICYNEKLCGGFYSNRTLRIFNNTTCRRPQDFPFKFEKDYLGRSPSDKYIAAVYDQLYKCNTILRNDYTVCNNSAMYQCINSSKCIAQIRLFDKKTDCDYNDDELRIESDYNCPIKNPRLYINCTNRNTCISRKLFDDGPCDCRSNIHDICDDEPFNTDYIKYHISFPRICNGVPELLPIITDNGNKTDETDCEQWPCNNIYTRCDGTWHCFNATDELDCHPSSLINCSLHSYVCFSPDTFDYMCLSSDKINDGNIDCIGATDESQLCQIKNDVAFNIGFHCDSIRGEECIELTDLCDGYQTCSKGEDEKFCHHIQNYQQILSDEKICNRKFASIRSDEEEFLCNIFITDYNIQTVYFSLDNMRKSGKRIAKRDTNMMSTSSSTTRIISENPHYCHRSLNLRIWLNKEKYLSTLTCLCPPSHYGDRCQYQNERVSLTIQFQAFSDSWQTPFIAVVLLIDDSDERIVHSHEQVTYIPVLNCRTKFNIDLLYSTRPKNQSKQYSIHIDIYEKLTLLYRGSLLIPLSFPFLPVQRVAVQLSIPYTDYGFKSCSDQQCVHGQCIRYFDDPKYSTFRQCNSGWSGRYCTIPHNCTCSSSSLCIGILANNRSICVCPMNKWGSRCLLHNQVCQSNSTCHHGGQCIPIDNYIISNKKFICICPTGFSGDRCEISQSKIIVSFEQGMILPQSILVHFIEVSGSASPENGTTFKRIPIDRNPVTVYWSRPFHIAFIEFVPQNQNYYLLVVQDTHNQSMTIERTLKSSNRCPNIREVFNETFVRLPLIRRIKYYHLPCQRHSPQLSCFYDDVHVCLCNDFDHQRHANCFEFNHGLKRDCRGRSNCKYDAQCLQDSVNCPQTSMCICPSCYYGALCQFSSTRFGLSLDAILGDHIQPHVSIMYQPTIVQIGITLTVLMTVIGLISGVFSMMTFLNKEPRKTGCGFYLIGSSSTTLLIAIIFSLKFWILLVSQMTYMTDRSFLHFQCRSIDYILRVGLHMDQWLNACVAIERAITATKGLNFDKGKSKKFAKFIIPILVVLTSSTNVHEIIYRELIDDDSNDDKRIWCVATYPTGIQVYTIAINIFHFCTPFLINLLSALIIIIKTARLRTAAKTQQNYRQVLFEQLQQHKHLLITPLLLVILGIPRLIISFIPGCMQSASDAWLFLSGYFISFIPPILTFFIFVVPSKTYKQEFYKTYRRYQKKIKTRFRLAP